MKQSVSKISIYGLHRERKAVLEELQRLGILEVKEVERQDDQIFTYFDKSKELSTFERNRNIAEESLQILDTYSPVKQGFLASLNGRKIISSVDYYENTDKVKKIMKISADIHQLNKKVIEEKAACTRLETLKDSLEAWKSLDISMRTKHTKSTKIFIGLISGQWTEEKLLHEIARQAPDIDSLHIEIVNVLNDSTCIFVSVLKKDSEELQTVLHQFSFSYPSNPSKIPPAEKQKNYDERIKKHQQEIKRCEKKILSYVDMREDLRFLIDYLIMRYEKYEVLEKIHGTKNVFVIEGYLETAKTEQLTNLLENKYTVQVNTQSITEDEDAPVVIKNRLFADSFQNITTMYSVPGKEDIDPTPFMAFFYFLLFGIMLADLGYGLLIAIVTGIILLKFNLEESMRRNMKMFFFCGLSTAFWGVIFGGFFGDVIPSVAKTFFAADVEITPIWFQPLDDPIKMLVFSIVIGAIHIFTGMALKAYVLIRAGKFKDAVYDVFSWMGFIIGMVLAALGGMMGLGTVVTVIGLVLAIAGAFLIIAFGGRPTKNPVKRILKGLYELYGIANYFSDFLSYSRLLALGLATGVIAQVFNTLGGMFGGGVVGAVIYAVIFVVGHALNIGINLIGSYVHTIRLQFVEFFSKFYEGGGKPFEPFSADTKYYKFEEDK